MHADEIEIDVELVGALVESQFPKWRGLPVGAVEGSGTDNAIFRLGEHLSVRLPRHPAARAALSKELRWLPALAPHLSLDVPEPIATGHPGNGYPWEWSVNRWVAGDPASSARIAGAASTTVDLARFISEFRACDPTGGPGPGRHNSYRGEPLDARDRETRDAIAELSDMIDTRAASAAWEDALRAEPWTDAPSWLHGDITPGNLVLREGRLVGVIDFGCLGVGDPACDLMSAWTVLDGESRSTFRRELSVDEASWERGRGWALSWAVIFIPYYRGTNPVGVAQARRTIDEVLADHADDQREGATGIPSSDAALPPHRSERAP